LLFFPLLNLATGTSLPLAIVSPVVCITREIYLENFDNWWDRHQLKYESIGIAKQEFEKFSMKKGFSKGDIIFIVRANPEKLKIGDVIIFNAGQANPIIHRIISIRQENGEYIFSTMEIITMVNLLLKQI